MYSNQTLRTFKEPNLYKDSLIAIYHNILNIIGIRLINKKNAKLYLTGNNSNTDLEENNLDLSYRRAKSIKDYLVFNWGADSNQVIIRTRNLPEVFSNVNSELGKEENRRVEISSDDPSIFSFLDAKDFVYESNPKKIFVKYKLDSKFPISESKINFKIGDEEYRSLKLNNNNIIEIPLKELGKFIETDTTVTIELEIQDSLGTIKREYEDLQLSYESVKIKQNQKSEDFTFRRSRIILSDYKNISINEWNRVITEILQKEIQPNSMVSIEGYTDYTGSVELNEMISMQRANSVATQLVGGIKDVNGFGESILLHDNSLPEGRMYCRTVLIVIKTPKDY